jgi:histidine kinase
LIESVFRDGRTVTFQNEYDAVRFNQLTGANRDFTTVIEATIAPVRDARGKVTHAMIQQTDLTELRLAEAEKDEAVGRMKQAHKMEAVGRLAAGVANEMSQPLAIIRAVFERTLHDLSQKKTVPQALTEDFREAVSQIDRISRVISHLRIHGRAKPVSLENIQLETVLDNALILIGPMLQIKGIEFIRDIQENLPSILCDAYRCEQIFISLFQYAIEALTSVKDKQIVLSAKVGDTHLTLCIKHNGVAGASDGQGSSFGADAKADEVGERAGARLSIVHDFVKEHKGDIRYVREPQASRFIITMPLDPGSG